MTLEAETAYDVAVVGGGAAGLSAARVRPPSGTGPRPGASRPATDSVPALPNPRDPPSTLLVRRPEGGGLMGAPGARAARRAGLV